MSYTAQPFALSDAELKEVERFAKASGLDQIGRMAAELRALRASYLTLANRHAKLSAMLTKPNPEELYRQDLDQIMGKVDAT